MKKRVLLFLVLALAILVVALPVLASGEVITVPTYALDEVTAMGSSWVVSLWPILVAVAALLFGPKAVYWLRCAIAVAAGYDAPFSAEDKAYLKAYDARDESWFDR